MKEDWWKYALLALAAIAWWFTQAEITDFKNTNKAQWQTAAKTKADVSEESIKIRKEINQELSKIKERLSYIEGVHSCEKQHVK